MIDITPQTSSRQEVNVGDEVRLAWRLNAQVNPSNLTFTVEGALGDEIASYSGADLREAEVEEDGKMFYEYHTTHRIEVPAERVEYALDDGVQSAVDTAKLSAQPRLTHP